jgi:arginase
MIARPAAVHIIGVPLDLGGGRRGVDMGPSAVRIAGIRERLTGLGVTVLDRGDIVAPIPEVRGQGDPQRKYIKEIAKVCTRLHQRALQTLTEGALPLVIGGDHSLGAGSVGASSDFAAQSGGEIGLLWVDAHGDMNTPATTPSGNVHGMPLAALLGQEPLELARIGTTFPKVRAEKTVLIGIRNLDDAEKTQIRDAGVHVFTMKDVDTLGIAKVMDKALAIATAGTVGVHVSFDLDVCDPSIAPGVGTPVKGGLNYREAHMVMELVADTGRVMAIDLVEINPILDDRNLTAILGAELALSALGMRIL